MSGPTSGSSTCASASSKQALAEQLRARLQRLEAARTPRPVRSLDSGGALWNRLFPQGGLRAGSLVEMLGEPGGGAGTLALVLARQLARQGGTIMVLDQPGWFYPPAAALLGVDLARLVVVRGLARQDVTWAWDQALRCPAVAAVWGVVDRLEPHPYRRLALAAEQGGTVGLLVRPHTRQGQPCWSEIQLRIAPLPYRQAGLQAGRRLRIEVTRCRHGPSGLATECELDDLTGNVTVAERDSESDAAQRAGGRDETYGVHLVSSLAHPASGRGAARA